MNRNQHVRYGVKILEPFADPGLKHCRKVESPEQGARTLQTDIQTDGRTMTYSEREREFTLAKNDLKTEQYIH